MATTTNPTTNPRDTRDTGVLAGAAILIVIGLAALLANLTNSTIVGDAVTLAIGLAFLTAYAIRRRYGFLVPGGIITGVGAGIVTASLLNVTDAAPYAVIGGGLGFLLIYAIDALVSRAAVRWWPIIPGSVMILVGSGMASENEGLIRQIGTWSPVLLILIGVLILVMRIRPASR